MGYIQEYIVTSAMMTQASILTEKITIMTLLIVGKAWKETIKMPKEIKELLVDCRETFEWIVESEYWEYMEEYSSAQEMINQINNKLKENE